MKHFPWHIPAIALFFPIFLYVNNADQSQPEQGLLACALSLVAALLLWGLLRAILKERGKAEILTSGALIVFYGFGRLHGLLHGYLLPWDFDLMLPLLGRLPVLGFLVGLFVLLSLCAVLWIFMRFVSRDEKRLQATHLFLSIATVALLLMQPLTYFEWVSHAENLEKARLQIFPPLPTTATKIQPGTVLPDIYYIVPDGYARTDTLKKHYAFDNSSFTNALKERGFQVPETSEAAFYWTYLSIGSTLNMELVTSYTKVLGKDRKDRTLPYYLLQNNRLMGYLKAQGYAYYQTTSTWGATRSNPFADGILRCDRSGVFNEEYYRVLVETTLLRPFLGSVVSDLASCHLHNFTNLETFAGESLEKPRFVFAHFMPPHHPYLFDRDGNVLRFATVSNQFAFQEKLWDKTDAYVDQLIYVNKRLLEVVDKIRKNSKRPAIIVIASDHGTHMDFAFRGKKHALDRHQGRLANFIAVSSPDPSFQLPDPINMVNVFRVILDHHFGANLPPISAQSFYSSYGKPYKFTEVPMPSQQRKQP
jgi:hypothetical protein